MRRRSVRPLVGQASEACALLRNAGQGIEQIPGAPSEAIQPGDDKLVTRTKGFENGRQRPPIRLGTALFLREYPLCSSRLKLGNLSGDRLPESLAPINWRRGFFRIWLLLSAAWIMGWALYLILFALQDGFAKIGDFLMIPVVFFGPPVAIFLLGMSRREALST
jgi:hypothetical protein